MSNENQPTDDSATTDESVSNGEAGSEAPTQDSANADNSGSDTESPATEETGHATATDPPVAEPATEELSGSDASPVTEPPADPPPATTPNPDDPQKTPPADEDDAPKLSPLEKLRLENTGLIKNCIKSGRPIGIQCSPEGHEYYKSVINAICNERNEIDGIHDSDKWHVNQTHGMFTVNNVDVKFIALGANDRSGNGIIQE